MRPEIVLMEVGEEVGEFLKKIHEFDLPVFDMDQVLDVVLGTLSEPLDQKEDEMNINLLAADIAYGDGMMTSITEHDSAAGFSPTQRQAMLEAVQTLGWQLRHRLMDLRLVTADGRTFSHHFKEIHCDHLLKLEEETPGSVSITPYGASPADHSVQRSDQSFQEGHPWRR